MLIHPKKQRVTLEPGFLLLAALLFYLDDGTAVLLWIVLSALFHELGHITAAMVFGGRIKHLKLTAIGAELRFSYSNPLSYWKENIIALAGPGANLLAGGVLVWAGCLLPGLMSLALGFFNAMPALPLDGGRIFYNLIAEHFGLDKAECVLMVSTAVLAGFLVGLGVIALVEYANLTILLGALWLLFCILKDSSKKTSKK